MGKKTIVAHRACLERRKNSAKYTIPPERVEFIRLLIEHDWGPEQIPAVSIDERPAIVESRERFGDWEIDTVLGKHGTGAIVT